MAYIIGTLKSAEIARETNFKYKSCKLIALYFNQKAKITVIRIKHRKLH